MRRRGLLMNLYKRLGMAVNGICVFTEAGNRQIFMISPIGAEEKIR